MKREQLEEIRARAEAATPGPWAMYDANEGSPESGPLWSVANDAYHNPPADEGAPWIGADVRVGDKADAEFVAHARTDVPALLDEIDRLTRELDTMREVAQGNKRHVAYLMTEIERGVPVSLGTECLRCRHVYNWHSNANGWCAVVVDGQQCGCYFVAPTTAEGSAEGGTSKGSEVSP